MFKKLGLGLAILVISAVNAFAGGAFNQYPEIGTTQNTVNPPGPGYSTVCTSFGNNNVCNQYQPWYGPTVPPLAYVPADTGLPGGQNPQTVTIPATLMGATTQDAAPLTGTTVTMNTGVVKLLLDPAGTIAALTVVMPTLANGLLDGQELQVSSTQTVTSLTFTPGTGVTVASTNPTTVGPNAPVNLIYHAATAKWTGE